MTLPNNPRDLLSSLLVTKIASHFAVDESLLKNKVKMRERERDEYIARK